MRGLTLIELMIAMVLGLLILAVAITAFMTNRRVYAATESLGRIQENTRTAFELMARDVRESAGNSCERDMPVVNVISNSSTRWWTDFSGGLTGYDGATASPGLGFGTTGLTRVTGTDAIDLKSAIANGVTVVDHQPVTATFKLNTINHGLAVGDIAMACDFDHAAVFQVTAASTGSTDAVIHAVAGTPGNTTACLSVGGLCKSGAIKTYGFGCRNGETPCAADKWPAAIAKLRMTRWFVGNNPRGGQSLYQASVQNSAGTLSVVNNEVVEGVRDMQLTFLVDGATEYVGASSATPAVDWSKVIAVRINMLMEGEGREGTDNEVLQRSLIHTVAIRNRAP